MAALTMSVTMERRAAKVTLNEWFEKVFFSIMSVVFLILCVFIQVGVNG